MNIPSPDTSRVKVTQGTHTPNNLATLASCHPFTQQLEVLFPENAKLEAAFAQLRACYAKGIFKLSEIAENGGLFIHSLEAQSKFLMLSIEKNVDDVWCIDSRGIVTMFLSKETYQKLGIVGRKLPFKRAKDERVVQFSLRKGTDTPGNVARRFAALRAWERRREQETGLGGWHVVYCSKDPEAISHPLSTANERMNEIEVKGVASSVRRIPDVLVPHVNLRPFPEGKSKLEESEEDWSEQLHALIEWVGMACLGSERLNLSDNVDPYIALYEPPPSNRGNLTHVRWKGLLPPAFVQLVINTALTFLDTAEQDVPFISIISHSVTRTPLAYISPKNTNLVPTGAEALRLPRDDGEDSWCLYATSRHPSDGAVHNVDWALAESVDKCDMRWG